MMTTVYDHLVKLKKNKNTEDTNVKSILSGYNGNVTALKQALKEYLDELKKATSVSEIPVPVVPVVPTVDTPDEQKVDTPGVGDVDQTDSSDTKSDVNQAGGIFEDVTQSQDGSESDNGHGTYTENDGAREFTIAKDGVFSMLVSGNNLGYGTIDNVKTLINNAVNEDTDKANIFKNAITEAKTYKDIKQAFKKYIRDQEGKTYYEDSNFFIELLPKSGKREKLNKMTIENINSALK